MNYGRFAAVVVAHRRQASKPASRQANNNAKQFSFVLCERASESFFSWILTGSHKLGTMMSAGWLAYVPLKLWKGVNGGRQWWTLKTFSNNFHKILFYCSAINFSSFGVWKAISTRRTRRARRRRSIWRLYTSEFNSIEHCVSSYVQHFHVGAEFYICN